MFGDLDYDPTYAYQAGEHTRLLPALALLCVSIHCASCWMLVVAALTIYNQLLWPPAAAGDLLHRCWQCCLQRRTC
jgi:hypothetical protein